MKTTEFSLTQYTDKLVAGLLGMLRKRAAGRHMIPARKSRERDRLVKVGFSYSYAVQITNDCEEIARLQYNAEESN